MIRFSSTFNTIIIFLVLLTFNFNFGNAIKCYECDELREGIHLTGNCTVEASDQSDCYDVTHCIYFTMYRKFGFWKLSFHNYSHSNLADQEHDQFYRKRMCGHNTYCSIYKPHKGFTSHCSECNSSDFCNTDVLDSSANGLRLNYMLILGLFFVITFFQY